MQKYNKETHSAIMAYTAPTTEDQKRYYNKHAPERSMYSAVLFILQLAWAITDFKGIQLVISSGLKYVPGLQWLAVPTTIFLLFALHGMLFVSIRSYWFDELDENDETDSPLWIPVMITLILLAASTWGCSMLLEKAEHRARITTTDGIDHKRDLAVAKADTLYQRKVDRLNYTLTRKHAAIRKAYRDSIRYVERRIANLDPVKYRTKRGILRRQRNNLRERRDQALNGAQLANAAQLDTALLRHQASIDRAHERHGAEQHVLQLANNRERALEASSDRFTRYASILVAASFALLFWLATYRFVRISVKSGILPQYHFSRIQKRGGVMKWYSLAIQDILARQLIRFAKFIHQRGTAGTERLSDLDGHFEFDEKEEKNDPKINGHLPLQAIKKGTPRMWS